MIESWYLLALAFFERGSTAVLHDVCDILIVAIGIYYVLLMLRGTRAMQMTTSLVILFAIYLGAKRFGLVTVHSLLENILTYLVFIVIIVFQHDIRRGLTRFGQRPFFRSARAAMEGQIIDEVIKAATLLAQKRIGGLVVFERDAVLDQFIETGTVLDATISKELIYSVFIPSFENPMHDGALIIRDGRVWQAGAFLPLTNSPKLDRTLGTRHRAAIGLTEETDAVVVVVSEERGSVSVCFNGNIVRSLDGAMLRKVLVGLFQQRARKKAKPERKSQATPVERTSRAPGAPDPAPVATPAPKPANDSDEVG